MDVVDVLPNLRMLRFAVGQAYLWRDADSLTLIDTGLAGSGSDIARAIKAFGFTPTDLDRVVLTHFHEDHTGSAADVGSWDGVLVMAHRRDDNVAAAPDGRVILGPFNLNRPEAARSFRRLAALDSSTAVFGHGDPVVTGAATVLREASRHLAGSGLVTDEQPRLVAWSA